MSFRVVVDKKFPEVFTVALYGHLDTETYKIFEKNIEPLLVNATQAIILDMKGVDYISSMGVGAIFTVRKFMEDNNGHFAITHLQPQVKSVFEILKVLPKAIFVSVEEMDGYLTAIQKQILEKGENAT